MEPRHERMIKAAFIADKVVEVGSWFLIFSLVFGALKNIRAIIYASGTTSGSGMEIALGNLMLELAPGYAMYGLQGWGAGLTAALMGAMALMTAYAAKTIRDILYHMKQGRPFHREVPRSLRKLGILAAVGGPACDVARNIIDAIQMREFYNVGELLINEWICGVRVVWFDFNLMWLAVGALLLLLSMVFAYGEQLQAESDGIL